MAKRRPLEEDEQVEVLDVEEDEQEQQSAGPSAKRARIVDLTFKKGTVKKIRVHNFMTYAGTVTITPGPRLNLLLGPNGTGKSSLVCALCVGLAGSTKLLGRADNLADYVRRNCSSCWTEITLSSGDHRPDLVIRRNISLETYVDDEGHRKRRFTSDYRINNQHASQEEVKKKVKSLNIQFDNLCQFLPQDKVVEFAKMNPQELLVATEKALGDSTLYDTHMELVEMRKEAKTHDGELVRLEQRLQDLEQQQQRQQRDYERYENRERLKKQATLRRHKVLWLHVEQAQKAKKAAERALKEAVEVLAQRCKEVEEEQGPVKALMKQGQAADAAAKKAKDSVLKVYREVQDLLSEVEQSKEHFEEALNNREQLKEDSKKLKSTISNLQREVADLQKTLDSLPRGLSQENLDRQAELQQQIREAEDKWQSIDEEKRTKGAAVMELQGRMSELQRRDHMLSTTREQRFRVLEQQNRDKAVALRNLHDWIKKDPQRFKGPVYGPAFLDIDVRPPSRDLPGSMYWASYVEKQCWSNLNNFVMHEKVDEETVSAFIRGQPWEHHIVLTTVTHPYNQPVAHNCGDASAYSQYGITHTLDEVFEAPQLIKHMLADLSGITSAFVGGPDTRSKAEQLFKNEARVRNVYADDVRMTYSVSRYNREATTTQMDTVMPARLLSGESLAVVEAERQRIATEMHTCQQERHRLEQELKQLDADANVLRERIQHGKHGLEEIRQRAEHINKQRASAQSNFTLKNRRLQIELNKPDPMDREPALMAQCEQLLNTMATKGGLITAKMQAYWAACKKSMYAELVAKEKELQCEAMRQQVETQQREKERALKAKQLAEVEATEARDAFRHAKAQAEEAAPLTDELKAEMRDLASDIETLEREADDLMDEAEGIRLNDEGVVREYEARKRRIDELKQQVEGLAQEQQQRDAALEAKKASWLPELQKLVGQISEKFSTNFREIGCAGEVELQEDPDYDKFAINIRVKFRDHEAMQLLTATRQSGGERSVSTILYLIALQGITETPFRVVDEINQGMDPVNERKVFIQLVESSCKPDTPQCFLLTPKLLPGLPFEPQISVLTIMNGAGVPKELIKCYDKSDQLSVLLGSRMQQAVAA